MLLISVNKEDYATEKYKPTPNVSFRAKLGLFERWFAKDPRFSQYHDRADRLTKALRLASEDRHLLAHCNPQEFIEGPPVRMIARKLDIGGDTVTLSRADWTEEQIRLLAKAFSNLSHGLWTISQEALTSDFLQSLQISESPSPEGR
jgi:hypothetical protein